MAVAHHLMSGNELFQVPDLYNEFCHEGDVPGVGQPHLLHPRVPCPLHLQAAVRRGQGGARVAAGDK